MIKKNSLAAVIIASILIASGISAIIAPRLSPHLNFLFSSNVPGVNTDLVSTKSLDLAEFGTTLGFSLLFCSLNYFVWKKWSGNQTAPVIYLLASGAVVFLLTRFATFSGTAVLAVVGLLELLLFMAVYLSRHYPDRIQVDPTERNLGFFAGIYLGFYSLLILNRLTPIVIFPLSVLVLLPIANYWLAGVSKKWSHLISLFPGTLVPLLLFFPSSLTPLMIWGAFATLAWFVSARLNTRFISPRILSSYIYPAVLVILVSYNPLFFIGHFDSVEEGFWSAWVQRLWQGQSLYKDVMVYHPPVLIWSLYFFEKIFGFTLYYQRLFMHLVQIAGAVIYLFVLKKVIRRPWVIAVIMLCFLGLTSTAVKNNVEIRVGLGLASVVTLSPILAALSLFTSPEVGLASIAASLGYLAVMPKNRLKSISKWLLGLGLASLPFIIVLFWQAAFSDFWRQISFYASAFSQGYFNSPVDRAISLSYLHWHIFNQYLGSTAMWFEVSKIVIFAGLIYGLLTRSLLLPLSIFGLVLERVALGRSDYFHLLFPLLVSLVIIGRVIDNVAETKKATAAVLASVLLLLGVRSEINSQYLENLGYRLQTYGTVVGEYRHYNFDRGQGILVGTEIDTSQTDNLIKYIRDNTTEDDYIFTYPWAPELYFLANRPNATSVDTPYAFFTPRDQDIMVSQLAANKPKLIIYNPDMNFGGLSVGALRKVDDYLKTNYQPVVQFGKNQVLQ